MAADNRFLDDLARMAGGAASLLSTVRRQIKSDLRERVESYTSRMDLAARDEVERLQATVSKFRMEQDQMKKKIADLETALGGKGAAKAKPANQNATKKTASKKPSKPSKRK